MKEKSVKTKVSLKAITCFIIFLSFVSNCRPNEVTTDEDNLLLAGLIASYNAALSTSIPETTCNTSKSSPTALTIENSITHTITNKDLCYFTFRANADATYIVTLTPIQNNDSSSSNTDVAVVDGATGGNKPTSFWSGTGINCTSFGWQSCVSNSGTSIETINADVTNGSDLTIGVFGSDCSSLVGCNFSLKYQSQ